MHIKLYDVNALCERKLLLGKSISRVLVPLGTQNFPPSGPTMVGPQVAVAGAHNVILPRGAKNTATPLQNYMADRAVGKRFLYRIDGLGPLRLGVGVVV